MERLPPIARALRPAHSSAHYATLLARNARWRQGNSAKYSTAEGSSPSSTPSETAVVARDGLAIAENPKATFNRLTVTNLRQTLLGDIARNPPPVTRPSLVNRRPSPVAPGSPSAAASPYAIDLSDMIPVFPPNVRNNVNKADETKRVRTDGDDDGDYASSASQTRSAKYQSALAGWRDKIELALAREERIYRAKVKMIQDCTDAVDKSFERVGPELQSFAKDFSTFFAHCLTEWLTTGRLPSAPQVPRDEPAKEEPTPAPAVASTPKVPEKVEPPPENTITARLPTKQENPDLRIYVRMDSRNRESSEVKSTLIEHLKLGNDELQDVTPSPSGFVLHPRDAAIRKMFVALHRDITEILGAKGIEEQSVWRWFRVKGCPREVVNSEGEIYNVTEEIFADEVQYQTGMRPAKCGIVSYITDSDKETTWRFSLPQSPRVPFRLFAQSRNVTEFPARSGNSTSAKSQRPH